MAKLRSGTLALSARGRIVLEGWLEGGSHVNAVLAKPFTWTYTGRPLKV